MLNHLGRPISPNCTYEDLISDFLRVLDTAKIGPAYYLGYSFGGFVAMTLARRHPERVKGVITLAGKFIFDDRSIAHIQHLFSPEYFQKVPPALREKYDREWGPMLPLVRANCSRMYGEFQSKPPLTEADLRSIEQRPC
jgi:pimeloyl-ACP methyl ester carboxylesterase